MKSQEFLREIRKSAGLERAVLKKITVENGKAVFYLVTDKTYSKDDIVHAKETSEKYVPEGLLADVNVMKSVPSAENVRGAIAAFLKERFPSAAAFISPDDIEVSYENGNGMFSIGVDGIERNQFDRANVLDELSAQINRGFCGVWSGGYHAVQKEFGELEEEKLPPAEAVFAPRLFPIANYNPIDDAKPSYAVYIADLVDVRENVSICGALDFAEERVTKNGKPYFIFTVTDASGQIRVSYFTRKTSIEKIRALQEGDAVCMTGDMELYNGYLSFRARYVDYGSPPDGFVFEARPSRPVPAEYKAVFPEYISDFVQGALFGQTALPEDFKRRAFVAFDLETTGLNSTPAGGGMDRIIEIGAVKIVNGAISEKFSSFVACPVKLSAEIVKLTGIDDGMLVGAPNVGDVLADFYKFSDGCELVGHNVQFDYNFIRYYGEQEGYLFNNKRYDTVTLAQRTLRLSNYKLNTVADYFGFAFHHHRAFDDAFVTAKIFIELVRMNGCVPE